MERKNAWNGYETEELKKVDALNQEYRTFLNEGKTERECVKLAVKMAEEAGYRDLKEVIAKKETLKAGDKVYAVGMKKMISLFQIGKKPLEEGMAILGAHIDSPRLDIKQNPLYEEGGFAYLDTHYYGGIKKYQWVTLPLAIHGVIAKKDGTVVDVKIGEDKEDPVFCVTDLLPHLAKDQMTKKMIDGIEGENLNILIGGMPVKSEDVSEKVKFAILKHLNEKYGITERDFLSAEIEIVPAFKAKNVGLDESFVGAYGQDDRVCAFTTLKGIFAVENPKKTALAILVDKEEIGSTGNTGMLSAFFEMTLAEIIEKINGNCTITDYNTTIENSACLSSDVGAAVDPNYESVYEKRNAAFAGCGMVLMKYTGARGKSESSDASAEFVYEIGKILDDNGVIWQTSELGKVDQGGGGTIAQYVANLNMDVIDCGVPVLSMHAPFEVTAKSDVYMAYKSYVAFYNNR